MAGSYPGSHTGFLPSWEASGKLQIEYSRNPKSFALNRYVGLKKVDKTIGAYLNINAEEASRIVSIQDYDWPGGAPRPDGNWNTEKANWLSFITRRFDFPFALDSRAVQVADYDVIATNARVQAQRAMTHRTLRVQTVLQNASNWGSSTATATAAGGGVWAGSAVANQYILKTFDYVKEQVHLNTQGAVNMEYLVCVVSPLLAHEIREAPEIIDFIKQQPEAGAMLKGTEFFRRWGVPEQLYGVRMVVEDTVRTTNRKGASVARSYVMPATQAQFLYAPDALDFKQNTNAGADTTVEAYANQPIFNTITLFMLEDMTVEVFDDTKNRRHEGHITEDNAAVLTASASGFQITGTI